MTVVIYAAGALLAVAAVVRDPTTLGTAFPILVTAASLAVAVTLLLLRRGAALRRTIGEIRQAESAVATGLVEAPRTDVAELIAQLRRLGFEMVGATDTSIGGGRPIRTWVLTDGRGPGSTWVEIGVARTPIAIFLSRSADGRFLETSYPDGATIDHPNLLARPIQASPDAALEGHRTTLAERASAAGEPLVVRTLDDYRRVEAELRERTGGMRIAAYLERVVEPSLRRWAISAGIGVATCFVLVLLPRP